MSDLPREAGRHVARSRLPAPLSWVPVPWLAFAVVVVLAATAGVVWYATSGSSGSSGSGNAAPAGSPGAPRAGSAAAPSPGSTAGCADATLARLSLEDKVGQLLMIGTPVGTPLNIQRTVERYRLGGVFLAGRSSAPAAGLRNALTQLQSTARKTNGVPLQIGADQEGGKVQTLSGPDFPTIPSAVTQGQWDANTLRTKTTDWAKRLKDVGITIDLAPVADTVPTDVGDANPPIGALDRQYGSTSAAVADDVATVVSAAQAAGVQTTLKHFPGLGRVRFNTDTSTNARDDATTANDPTLQPFARGIAAGTTAVMISSALYPKLDPNAIAAFSTPIVTGLLRQQMGFTGLVMSDDLGAADAVESVPLGDRAVRFIKAGGDVVLTVRSSDAEPMTNALLAAAKGSPEFAARVTESAGRVLTSKVKAGLLTCG